VSAAPALRLFTALWPGPVTRRALQAWADTLTWPAGARRVRPTDLHLTLHFLGEVPADRLPALREALRRPSPRVSLVLDRASVFHGGTLVLEPAAVPEPLAALQALLDERLRALDLPLEARRWRPHVTLARHARAPVPPPPTPPLPWHSQGHVLVASRPGSGYEVLQRFGQ
jgi:RNA 2',3'-cyclic 3'-phosphodiesterase